MADNVTFQSSTLATPPDGLVVSTDDAGADGQVQRMKLAYSADGVATHVPADADGLLVNLGANNDVVVSDGGGSITVDGTFWQATQPVSIAAAVAVTDNAGSLTVDGATTSYLAQKRISVTPTISAASIYASGDAVGGLLTFSNAARVSGGSITVQSVVIIDNDQELAPLELVLFDRTFTATSDNAAFDPTDADLANCIGVVKVSDYASFNDNSVATRAGIGLAATLNGTDLFGQLVVRSAPTYTATNDIIVIVQVVQD